MKLLLINSVCGTGSTGRICESIADEYESRGWDVRIAYGRASGAELNRAEKEYGVRIGTDLDVKLHGQVTRVYDLHGFGSKRATEKFVEWAEEFEPDLIWLHNIHGYYVNIEILFNWIKSRQEKARSTGREPMKVNWTLHDCWSFTGHCSHFTFVKCDRWKNGCYDCPQKREYPASLFLDSSRLSWKIKKQLFTGVENLTIITPSHWLEGLVKQSFLKEYPVEVHHNKVDGSIFKPTLSDFRERYGLEDRIILLGVSGIWNQRKGLDDFIKLDEMLNRAPDEMIGGMLNGVPDEKINEMSGEMQDDMPDARYQIVLVGVTDKQAKELSTSTSIIPITKTENQQELAQIYSSADVFLNLSKEETFGLTTLEAISCGTRVIVYKDTACEEVVKEYGKSGDVAVEQGVDAVLKTIESTKTDIKNRRTRKSRVLYITNIPSPYRVDFFNELGKVCDLAVLFEREGSSERDDSWKRKDYNNFNGIILKGVKFGIDRAFCPQIVDYLKKNKYDYIFVTNIASPTGLLAIAWMQMNHISYYCEGDGGMVQNSNRVKTALKTLAIKNAKKCFSTSKAFDEYCKTYGAKKEDIIRYPFSSVRDCDVLEKPCSRIEKVVLRGRLGIDKKYGHILLSVGRVIPLKGFDVLLKAVDVLTDRAATGSASEESTSENNMDKQPANNSWLVLIIGGQPYEGLKYIIKEHNLVNVMFLDFVPRDQIFDYMKASDVFILPTKYDPWGLVINEAMACGLPIITTYSCGAGTELVDGSNGWLYGAEDVNALRSVFIQLDEIVENQERTKELSVASLTKIKSYTIETMVDAHIKHISAGT